MNKTKIDWCDYSWNIATGCYHDCRYCYARRIAERFGYVVPELISEYREKKIHEVNEKGKTPYPFIFKPTFHRHRLEEPLRKKKGVTIFVCSMGDLFGEWVPDKWIEEVFEACKKAPQHRYLFLTKNPKRYIELSEKFIKNKIPNNFWFGCTTVDRFQFAKAGNALGCIKVVGSGKTFLSVEPIQSEDIVYCFEYDIRNIDWIIVGSETGNSKDKIIPKREWIMDIKKQCKNAGVPLFMKESLMELMRRDFVQEFPW